MNKIQNCLILLLVIAFLSSCSNDRSSHSMDHSTKMEGNSILSTLPKLPIAGVPTQLSFGLNYDILIPQHARKLHVVIINEDFSNIGHIHPFDFGTKNEDSVYYTFPKKGKYLIAIDYMNKNGKFAKKFLLDVHGTDSTKNENYKTSLSIVKINSRDIQTSPVFFDNQLSNYSVEMSLPEIYEGKETLISYHFKKNEKPVRDFSPYLAAPMHFAIVKKDLSEFIHTHGGPREFLSTMKDHGNDGHDHSPSSFGPNLDVLVTFPNPGEYIVFGQIKHKDNLIVHRSIVNVLPKDK